MEVEKYDFNSCFEIKVDGKDVDITSEMVKSTVKASVGNYEYTVSLNGVSKCVISLNSSSYKFMFSPPSFEIVSHKILNVKTIFSQFTNYLQI